MTKNYESPMMEIEKFTLSSSFITTSDDDVTPGWGGNGDEYDDIF